MEKPAPAHTKHFDNEDPYVAGSTSRRVEITTLPIGTTSDAEDEAHLAESRPGAQPSPKQTKKARVWQDSFLGHQQARNSNEKAPGLPEKRSDRIGAWGRLVKECRKNYYPRTPPLLVLPTAPTDKEKYAYTNMNRPLLVSCGTLTFLILAVGGWMFAKASPAFAWFALYAFFPQFYLLTTLFIMGLGKQFDLAAHKELVESFSVVDAPTVDIYLPVCKEPLEMIENTWKYIALLDYDADKKRIYVLDDGADENIRSLAYRYGFSYVLRPNRPKLKKAGNLRHAFAQTSGEFFAVFDADFCPRPDFLLETVPHIIADDRRAIIQTPQFFRSRPDQTWTEQGAGAIQEHIYRIMQHCRDTWAAAICVGSNAIYRRAALEPIGGIIPYEASEDIHTGFYVATHGWTIKNVSLNLACGVCPDTPRAFFAQQVRWCTGSVTLAISRDFWRKNNGLSGKQKFCHIVGFLYYPALVLQAWLIHIPAPLVLWVKPDLFKYYNLFFPFGSIFISVVALRIWARGRYTLSVQYVEIIMSFAFLQAMWDIFRGTRMGWTPTGGRGGEGNAPLLRLSDVLNSQKSNDDQLVEDLDDLLRYYYKLAQKQFVHAVSKGAVHYLLLTMVDGPLRVFSPTFVGSLSEE
ncbi:hypothetical protein MMC28_001734 [Mycoblastus sanguinarius]|nr:hypothetical protein [Mycoblastus sanguinarius]